MAHPCCGPFSSVRRMRRSSVPCRRSSDGRFAIVSNVDTMRSWCRMSTLSMARVPRSIISQTGDARDHGGAMKRSRSLAAGLLVAAATLQAQSSARPLVLNKEDATFVIVDPVAGKVLGTVPVGQGPHELAVSTDGKSAFASNYGTGPAPGSTISMIDIATLKEVRRIDVSPLRRPHGLWFSGGKLYFSAEADKKIARYDLATNKIDWEFETGQTTTHMVTLTK